MKIIASTILTFVMALTLNSQNATNVDLTQARFGIKNAEEIFKDFEIVPLETHIDKDSEISKKRITLLSLLQN